MSYMISPSDNWLTVSPQTGSSQGEPDTITVSYNNALISNWGRGTYGTTDLGQCIRSG